MSNDYSNIILLFIFGIIPLAVIIYFHRRTFLKNIQIIIKINLFIYLVWILGGSVAYRQNVWLVSYDRILNQPFIGVWVGDVFQSIVGTTLISMVTLLMLDAYSRNLRFRDLFFKKE
ncbi:MAG: hypothetical protein M1484_03895 [Patescibacteria group bacterium]|nr:hypothetical protein [Patescibacteria group bacterium]MCL5432204.1 hypothetical protein [Patescibacteria group bacterium]